MPLLFGGSDEALHAGEYLFGKASHLGFERLELKHEQFDPCRMEGANPRCHLVIAANQPCRGSTVGADAGRLRRVVVFDPKRSEQLLDEAGFPKVSGGPAAIRRTLPARW
jgi:hypothetical protein